MLVLVSALSVYAVATAAAAAFAVGWCFDAGIVVRCFVVLCVFLAYFTRRQRRRRRLPRAAAAG